MLDMGTSECQISIRSRKPSIFSAALAGRSMEHITRWQDGRRRLRSVAGPGECARISLTTSANGERDRPGKPIVQVPLGAQGIVHLPRGAQLKAALEGGIFKRSERTQRST